jgi:lipopolysaccharide transport system permease protein
MADLIEKDWDLVIRPKRHLFDINLKELWEYRDLIMVFVRRDFVSRFKQTILGPFWFLLGPLFSTFIYSVIFSSIAKIPTDGAPPALFYLSGIVIWSYFAGCLSITSGTFLSNAGIFGKVYFPRLVTPISGIISTLIQFGIQFLLLACLFVFYAFKGMPILIGWSALLIPVHIIVLALMAMGFGIIISSLTVKYRDLSNLMSFGLQLWMYATPVIYPVSAVPEKYRFIVMLNPVAPVVESFKSSLLGTGAIHQSNYLYSVIFTGIILFIGILLFNKVENKFMDTI